MPIYKQAPFIADSIRAAMAQDCPPTEILISDDCSPDNTYEVARQVVSEYTGPHRVQLWRNERNLGTGNLASCVARATGRYIAQFHGDDISHPHRATRLHEAFAATGASLISTNSRLIDENGKLYGALLDDEESRFLEIPELTKAWSRLQSGSTQAFDREIFQRFLPWKPDTYWMANDHILPFRASLLNGAYFLNETLLDRRQHDGNFGKLARPQHDDQVQTREFTHANFLNLRAFMLRDLRHFVEANGESDRTRLARASLLAAIEGRLDDWCSSRSTLLNQGRRPTWLTAAERQRTRETFASDIPASDGSIRFWRRQSRRLARTMRSYLQFFFG